MRRRPGKGPAADVLPAMAGDTTRLAESCGPLLLDFPDPVLIADRHRRVVFLNRAAEKIFGATLRPGDLCPICGQLTGLPLSVDGTVRQARCLEPGESLRRAPILPKAGWAGRTPLTVTATPIKGRGNEPA
ncbi:MAG: PAS domain-containing protein, partial [Desulfobaccales bacterium]